MSADDSVDSNEGRLARLIALPFHRELFKSDGAVTQGQVLSAFGNVTLGLSEEVITALVEKVELIKSDVRSWGLQQVKAKIVQHFNQCSQMRSFGTIGQVAEYWKQTGTVEAAGKLWYACYGAFDEEPGWDVQLEKSYMEMCEYKYKETGVKKKGCFARSIGLRKTDIIKSINRKSATTHKGSIRMKRSSEEMDEKTRFKKRKKGTTIGGFAKLDGQVKYDPAVVVNSSKHKDDEKKVKNCLLQFVLNKSVANEIVTDSRYCYRY
jgi:hypothetical protein